MPKTLMCVLVIEVKAESTLQEIIVSLNTAAFVPVCS